MIKYALPLNRKPIYKYPAPFSLKNALHEIIDYRDFWFYLAVKWIKIKYDESYLGFLWVLINPILIAAFYAWVFGFVLGNTKGNFPYFLIVYAGFIVWQFFRDCFLEMGESFLREPAVLKRANFPKLIIPLSLLSVKMIEFLISLVLVILLCGFYGVIDQIKWGLFLTSILSMVLFTAGLSMLAAPLFVLYRDIKHAARFIIPYVLYTLPVLFSPENAPASIHTFWLYNPLASGILLFRAALFNEPLEKQLLIVFLSLSVILFLSGLFIFNKVEKKMIDLI